MKTKTVFYQDQGDGYDDVIIDFLNEYTGETFENEEGNACVWVNSDGEIASVLFDDVNLKKDMRSFAFKGSNITCIVNNGEVTCTIQKNEADYDI